MQYTKEEQQLSLKIENEELKRALALSLNRPLIKRLRDALSRISRGDFMNEEQFFKNS